MLNGLNVHLAKLNGRITVSVNYGSGASVKIIDYPADQESIDHYENETGIMERMTAVSRYYEQTDTSPILSFTGDYSFLSNFYPCRVVMPYGEVYPTSEHAYQAMKTLDLAERKQIREAGTPGKAKRLGRKCTLRPDWESVKLAAMRQVLTAKFAQLPLAYELVGTGERVLIEGNHWGDRYWGVCGGAGENHLGKLLMEVREHYLELWGQ